MCNGDPPKVGKYYCDCGGSTKRHFKSGHDRRALNFVVQAEYGSMNAFLEIHGYNPGQAESSVVATNIDGSIAAFLLARGYGREARGLAIKWGLLETFGVAIHKPQSTERAGV